jgi:hypothetical protein
VLLLGFRLGNAGSEAELLQFPDVPSLQVELLTDRVVGPQEDNLVVFHAAAVGHVRIAAGQLSGNSVHVLDLPRREPVAFRSGWHGMTLVDGCVRLHRIDDRLYSTRRARATPVTPADRDPEPAG